MLAFEIRSLQARNLKTFTSFVFFGQVERRNGGVRSEVVKFEVKLF